MEIEDRRKLYHPDAEDWNYKMNEYYDEEIKEDDNDHMAISTCRFCGFNEP